MKKFYIPTSTLNFNNILSSESISPKSFYDKRGYGYSRWNIVPENPFNNAIVLYDTLGYFERPKSDIEDHPLLIEVYLDESQLKQADNFWYCDHTIYLTPTSTRFLFYTPNDRTIALSMSESSLESKLLLLYTRCIETIRIPSKKYKPISSNEPCELNEFEIDKDVRINKMKGMLYGYYIGALLSLDIDSVKHINVLKEIYNIFAAILSSFDKRPTSYQADCLDNLFEYLNEHNSDYKYLYDIVSAPKIDDKTKTKRIWSWLCSKRGYLQNEDKSYWLSCLQYPANNDDKENKAITWIKKKLEDAKKLTQTQRHPLNPDSEEIILTDNMIPMLKDCLFADEKEKNLCISWLTETLSDKNTNGKISTYNSELATKLTLKAKDVYQNNWDGCQTRVYLNDLRRHIAGEDFNHDWNNGLLSSIAAVLLAGDNWEKLLAYMQNKEMTDYKLAFAFYGTLNGFANMTRDFTDILYNQDKNYVWCVYKELYGQLLGDMPVKVDNTTVQLDGVNQDTHEQKTQNNKDYEESPIARAIKGHPKYDEKKLGDLVEKLLKQNISNWDKARKLSKKKDWASIIDDLSKEKNTPKKIVQSSLFDDQDILPVGQFFYNDKNIWYYIEPLIDNSKTKKDLKKEIDWIQEAYQNGGYKRKNGKWVDCKDTDNKSVIDHLYNNAKTRININILDSICNRLKQLYNVV